MFSMARRARVVEAGRDPGAGVRLFASTMFAMLVHAIRRGTRLATAMDARGFDSGLPRTYARRQHFGRPDVLLIVGAAALGAMALWASVAAGTFNPVFR